MPRVASKPRHSTNQSKQARSQGYRIDTLHVPPSFFQNKSFCRCVLTTTHECSSRFAYRALSTGCSRSTEGPGSGSARGHVSNEAVCRCRPVLPPLSDRTVLALSPFVICSGSLAWCVVLRLHLHHRPRGAVPRAPRL